MRNETTTEMGRSNNKGRGFKRGGRGYGSDRRNTNNPPKKKTLKDYYFYIGSNKQASDFETTNGFIINHIKKEFKHSLNISDSLRLLVTYDSDT